MPEYSVIGIPMASDNCRTLLGAEWKCHIHKGVSAVKGVSLTNLNIRLQSLIKWFIKCFQEPYKSR